MDLRSAFMVDLKGHLATTPQPTVRGSLYDYFISLDLLTQGTCELTFRRTIYPKVLGNIKFLAHFLTPQDWTYDIMYIDGPASHSSDRSLPHSLIPYTGQMQEPDTMVPCGSYASVYSPPNCRFTAKWS